MTNAEAMEMAKAKLECLTREVSGINEDCIHDRCGDCEYNYTQGNMGEQKEWLRLAIKALEQKWIPVSERLPKEDVSVFVYLFDKSPYIAWRDKYSGRWETDDFTVDADEEPIAWMPLPEPYKAESEG